MRECNCFELSRAWVYVQAFYFEGICKYFFHYCCEYIACAKEHQIRILVHVCSACVMPSCRVLWVQCARVTLESIETCRAHTVESDDAPHLRYSVNYTPTVTPASYYWHGLFYMHFWTHFCSYLLCDGRFRFAASTKSHQEHVAMRTLNSTRLRGKVCRA